MDRARSVLSDITGRCKVELFSAHPGIPSEQAMAASFPHDMGILSRGVRMRGIYQHIRSGCIPRRANSWIASPFRKLWPGAGRPGTEHMTTR
ncbi:hypothetical protein BJY16_001433 [Actinoplanes octamycinicus]|uniref:Uncharacterized protein n=1 Tax=Actinoplanes octamycinicus TaxID=135948 RepID=A0A7W7M5Q2_9ACTN|nr:hypothetical protein [Actinoplanes octamycinicus]GIE58975.1 hypothetical protein Aoc01nite_43770 [Actinoplanes octamycinicus]